MATMDMPQIGVVCGHCGGPVYMETCETRNGKQGHHWTLTSECQQCGNREDTQAGCLDCKEPPMRYRKKPVVIDAVRYEGEFQVIHDWLDALGYQEDDDPAMWQNADESVTILTLEGEMRCDVGDWVLRGVAGEFYPCKPEIFEATYEAVA